MDYDFETMLNRHGHDSIAVDPVKNDQWGLPEGETDPSFDRIPLGLYPTPFQELREISPITDMGRRFFCEA